MSGVTHRAKEGQESRRLPFAALLTADMQLCEALTWYFRPVMDGFALQGGVFCVSVYAHVHLSV